MLDPMFILGLIAVACLLLYPIRVWRKRHRRYGNEEGGGDPVPLAPPERRNDG